MTNLVFLPTENKGLTEYGPLMAKNVFRFIILQIYYIFYYVMYINVHLGIRENKFFVDATLFFKIMITSHINVRLIRGSNNVIMSFR